MSCRLTMAGGPSVAVRRRYSYIPTDEQTRRLWQDLRARQHGRLRLLRNVSCRRWMPVAWAMHNTDSVTGMAVPSMLNEQPPGVPGRPIPARKGGAVGVGSRPPQPIPAEPRNVAHHQAVNAEAQADQAAQDGGADQGAGRAPGMAQGAWDQGYEK